MYALQNQNVERKTAKQIDIKNLNHVENKETTNISELNTKSDTSVIGEENVVTNMSVKNEVTDAILNTLDTENLENLDTL
jgi:hypothetical protein